MTHMVLLALLWTPPSADYDVLFINRFLGDDGRCKTRLVVCRGQTKRWFCIVDVVEEFDDLTITRSHDIYHIYWKYAPGNEPMREYLITTHNVYVCDGFSIVGRLAELEWFKELYRHRKTISPIMVWDR